MTNIKDDAMSFGYGTLVKRIHAHTLKQSIRVVSRFSQAIEQNLQANRFIPNGKHKELQSRTKWRTIQIRMHEKFARCNLAGEYTQFCTSASKRGSEL